MENCIFCKIVAGEIPSYKIFEDEDTYAFLDIHPINNGHVLVIPKKHVQFIYLMDEELYQKVMKIVQKVMISVEKAIQPSRVGLIVEGFDVNHAHIKVVPLNDIADIKTTSVDSELNTEYFLKIQQEIIASLD